MSTTVGSATASGEAASRAMAPTVSLVRLYTLRVCYFILAAGLGTYYWPSVISHSSDFAAAHGIQFALLAGLGLTAVLGLRYPVQMIPLLLFELTWKAVYLSLSLCRYGAHTRLMPPLLPTSRPSRWS